MQCYSTLIEKARISVQNYGKTMGGLSIHTCLVCSHCVNNIAKWHISNVLDLCSIQGY